MLGRYRRFALVGLGAEKDAWSAVSDVRSATKNGLPAMAVRNRASCVPGPLPLAIVRRNKIFSGE
jgi:hypothetical protein